MLGSADIKVRPLKLALMVDPNRASEVREAIRLACTVCLASGHHIALKARPGAVLEAVRRFESRRSSGEGTLARIARSGRWGQVATGLKL